MGAVGRSTSRACLARLRLVFRRAEEEELDLESAFIFFRRCAQLTNVLTQGRDDWDPHR